MRFDSKCNIAASNVLLWLLLSPERRISFFFGGIQQSPVDGCSAASCNFGVLAGEDECMSFYKLMVTRGKGQGGGSDLEFWIDMYTLQYLNR